MGQESVDRSGSLLLQELRRPGDGVRGIRQIIHENARTLLYIADEHHGGVLPVRDLGRAALLHRIVSMNKDISGSRPYLVNQGEAQAQVVGNSSGTLCAARVWTDNDRISKARNLSFDVPLQ